MVKRGHDDSWVWKVDSNKDFSIRLTYDYFLGSVRVDMVGQRGCCGGFLGFIRVEYL